LASSFAQGIKNELARHDIEGSCCVFAELRALVQMSGRLVLDSKTANLILQTESPAVARRQFLLCKKAFDISPRILFFRNNRLQKNNTFLLEIRDNEKVREILYLLGFLAFKGDSNEGVALKKEEFSIGEMPEKCCRRAYLRGAFLAAGSLTNPEKDYHLELVAPYKTYAEAVKEVLHYFNLQAGVFHRKQSFVVYMKGGEKIAEFLRVISAHNGLFNLENIMILKGMRNMVNRLVNCETANLTKTALASHEQVSNIKLIQEQVGLENLSPSLREIALLRLRFPEATIKELGNLAEPALSKSCVNHRLRRLNNMARSILSS